MDSYLGTQVHFPFPMRRMSVTRVGKGIQPNSEFSWRWKWGSLFHSWYPAKRVLCVF